jgi:hypothetical protein
MPQVVAAAAIVANTAVIGTITVGTIAKGALLIGGLARGIRAQRKARELANASLQDRTTPVRSSDMARSVVYGQTRVADILAYHVTHGNRRDIVSHVIVLAGHEITAIDDVWFNDKTIGALDGNGNVQAGSSYFVSRQAPNTEVFTGVAAAATLTLPLGDGTLVALDSLVYEVPGLEVPLGMNGEAGTTTLPGEIVTLVAGTDYTLAGNVITMVTGASDGYSVTATYRIEFGVAYARVLKFLGTAAGERDTDLESWSAGEWPTTAVGKGVPRVHVLTFWQETLYALGFPSVSCIVRGKKVYDPRLDSTNGGTGTHRADTASTWAYSANPALCAADYLRDSLGFGCASTEIDWPAVIESANVCDELVPTDGDSATQSRYVCAGVLRTDVPRQTNLEDILDAMLGTAFWSAGKWTIRAGAYRTPTMDLDQTDMVGPLRWKARAPRRELFNSVRGRFRDPGQLYAVTDYPPYVSGTYAAEDGETLYREIDMPMVDNAVRAQRIAKLALFRARQALTIEATFKLGAYALQPGDTVRLTHSTYGWTNKVFRVTRRRLIDLSVVTLELQEEASAVYAWDFSEATNPDPAPNSNLPDPRHVRAPLNVSIVADANTYYTRQDGVIVPYARVSWAQLTQDDAIVEVHWKRAQDAEYVRISTAIGATEARIEGVARGEVLNAYVLARNAIGAQSRIVWIPSYVVGDVVSRERTTSANLVKNASFEYAAAHWSVFETGGTFGTTFQKHATPGFFVVGTPSSAYLHIRSTLTGNGYGAAAFCARVSAEPGVRYAAFAHVIGWGTDAFVNITFRDGNGDIVGGANGNTDAGVPVGSATRRFDRPDHHALSAVAMMAPADTRFVELYVFGQGAWLSGPDKYLSIYKPYLGEIPPAATSLPPWDPGGHNMIDTPDIADDALEWKYTDRVTSSRVIPPIVTVVDAAPYIPQAPHVFMPPHSGQIPDGALMTVRAQINIETTITAAAVFERNEITLILGMSVLEYDESGTTLLTSRSDGVATVYSHLFADPIDPVTLSGRKLYGTGAWESQFTYRADRRYLFGILFGDPVSGTPPAGWVYVALPGGYVSVTAHKTLRGA